MATTTTRPEKEEEERENEDEKGGVKTSAIINARAEEEEDLFSSSSVGTLLLGKNKAEARETIERWRGTANGGRKGGKGEGAGREEKRGPKDKGRNQCIVREEEIKMSIVRRK